MTSPALGPRVGSQMYQATPQFKQNLQQISADLEDSVDRCCPPLVKTYNRVTVLALRWENDDMGVKTLENKLLEEFKNGWNFNTENFVIPAGPSRGQIQALLNTRLNEFKIKYDEEYTLMILVYSGHGSLSNDQKHYNISGKLMKDPTKPSRMILHTIQLDLFEMDKILRRDLIADCCYVIDSCYAADLARANTREVEIFAAAGLFEMAGAQLHTSFTRRLIDILESNRRHTSFGEIFSQMMSKYPGKGLKAMPVHFPRQDKAQIQLMPVVPSEKYLQPSDVAPLAERKSKLMALLINSPRILVSVRLKDNVTLLDIEKWKKWLEGDIPVKIEAIFSSESQLLLLTMPAQLWSMLPVADGAWSFVGIVQSNNLLPQLEQAAHDSGEKK